MKNIMVNRGLTPEDIGFAVGLSGASVTRVLENKSESRTHVHAVKRFLSIPRAITVKGKLGIRKGPIAIHAEEGTIRITNPGSTKDAYVKVGKKVHKSTLTEGYVYTDGVALMQWVQGKWWAPTNNGVSIIDQHPDYVFEVTKL